MKWGVLEYKNPKVINIGDGMQILSVVELYESMGIKKDELIRIDYFALQTYEGEEVVLPICFPFYGYQKNNRITCFSPKIRPVFLALSLFDTNLEEDEILYLKQFEPIGCRDEFTAEGLKKKGIRAYVNGCMTLNLHTRKRNPSANKVYGIDIPEELVSYMPEEIRQKLVPATNIYRNIAMKVDEYAGCLLDEYAEQAKLVVTTRLHAAIPCYAAGIPVVFVNTEYSYRFSWLEDMIPVYLPEEWGRIDWNGSRISGNERALAVRKLMGEIACARLLGAETESKTDALRQIYDARKRRAYTRGPLQEAVSYMKTHWKQEKEPIEYAVWGVHQVASGLMEYIKKNYPQARCTAVIDASKQEAFKGIVPQKIEDADIREVFVFVTADAVNPYAIEYFAKIGKDPSTYFFCWKHIKVSVQELPESGGIAENMMPERGT